MAQVRKTRQQKIQQSIKKTQQVDKPSENKVGSPSSTSTTLKASQPTSDLETGLTPTQQQELKATQLYVAKEMKQIGWISLASAILLLVATVLLADYAWVEPIRDFLHLPQLFS